MNIIISNSSELPIYLQIVNQIKEAILSNNLKENEQLPSIRALAKDLNISFITTKRAYEELEKQNLITISTTSSLLECGSIILPFFISIIFLILSL